VWMGEHRLIEGPQIAWEACGGLDHTSTAERPASDVCGHCPPRPCPTCGMLEHPTLPRCDCWVDLSTLAPADAKALFARAGWSFGGWLR
jgi:hypothetical protein